MFNPSNSWPATKAAQGTMFFAQCMREFLDKSSFEGFRAYSLDTIGRLREARSLLDDILAKRVREPALQSVLDELVWSIENDQAARKLAGSQCQLFIGMCTQKANKVALVHACIMLERKLAPNYRQELIERVVTAINEDRRIEILSSVGYLVSHLINEGHNREYMIDHIDERFFAVPVKKVGAAVVRGFIRKITETKRNWITLRAVNPTARSVLSSFDDWTVGQIADFPIHAQLELNGWNNISAPQYFAAKTVSAADPFQAAVETHNKLDQVR